MFKTLIAFLGLTNLIFENGKPNLSEEQLGKVDARITELETANAALETAKTEAAAKLEASEKLNAEAKVKADADAKALTEMQARITELEKKPGANTAGVRIEKDPILNTETNDMVVSESEDFETNLAAVAKAYGLKK